MYLIVYSTPFLDFHESKFTAAPGVKPLGIARRNSAVCGIRPVEFRNTRNPSAEFRKLRNWFLDSANSGIDIPPSAELFQYDS